MLRYFSILVIALIGSCSPSQNLQQSKEQFPALNSRLPVVVQVKPSNSSELIFKVESQLKQRKFVVVSEDEMQKYLQSTYNDMFDDAKKMTAQEAATRRRPAVLQLLTINAKVDNNGKIDSLFYRITELPSPSGKVKSYALPETFTRDKDLINAITILVDSVAAPGKRNYFSF
jgi:hypothetical protein